MAKTAADVMQTGVLTVDPQTPLVDVHRLFVEEEINGAPVVDETGSVIGVISSSDLLRAVEQVHETASTTAYHRELLEFSSPDWVRAPDDFQDRLAEQTVSDVMSVGGISVAPDAPISDVARTLRSNRIHRVLVVEDEELRGIISSFDLVALLEAV